MPEETILVLPYEQNKKNNNNKNNPFTWHFQIQA